MTLRDLPQPLLTSVYRDQFTSRLRSLMGVYHEPIRVYRGVYLAHVNFSNEIESLISDNWPSFHALDYGVEPYFNAYGVVDHWTQLPLRRLDEDERPLLVYLASHVKADQYPTGGWRWHKWGPYLGVFQEQVATHEYLYDTPDVTEVYSYSIVELRETA